MTGRVGVSWSGGSALLAMIAASGVGCGDVLDYTTTSGVVEVVAMNVAPGEAGSVVFDATLELTLTSYEDGDDVALDAMSMLLGGDPMTIDDVVVDRGDWPVALAADEPQSRTLRVTGHLDRFPDGTYGLCAASLLVDVNVGLLVGAGETTVLGTGEAPFAPSGPRLGLARSGSEVAPSFDTSFGTVATTIDEQGTTWMLVSSGYAGEVHLVTRRASGEVEVEALPVFSATMAAAPGGGVVVAESFVGSVEVSRRRGVGDVVWSRTVVTPVSAMESYAPIAAGPEGVAIAVEGSAGASVDGLAPVDSTRGSVLVELDLEGAPRSIAPIVRPGQQPTWVSSLASLGDTLVIASDGGLFARRGDDEIWSAPFPTSLLAAGAGRIVAAGHSGVATFDAESGAEIWMKSAWDVWSPSSMAVRASGEVLLASSIGSVARWAADGTVLFDDQVVCSQPVAFGSTTGRVAYAAIVAGREGWGDAPDREVPSPLLVLGEVLP